MPGLGVPTYPGLATVEIQQKKKKTYRSWFFLIMEPKKKFDTTKDAVLE